MYIDIFRLPRDGVRKKRLEKLRTNSWFLLHDNAPAHLSVLVKDFLTKKNVTTLDHPPYSPGLAAADLYLYPWLKSAQKGRRFCGATDIIKNATGELKMLPQNGFQKYSQHIYSRWQKCIVAQWGYFEKCLA
jgi:histone-lysine N-methyltransferase SETMAR